MLKAFMYSRSRLLPSAGPVCTVNMSVRGQNYRQQPGQWSPVGVGGVPPHVDTTPRAANAVIFHYLSCVCSTEQLTHLLQMTVCFCCKLEFVTAASDQ